MSKVFHGGYRLIDLGGVDLASAGSGVVVAGIYDACVGLDLKKRVVLTNFKVSGVIKNEVEAQLSKSGNDFVIPGIYGYDLTIKKSDGKVYSEERQTIETIDQLYGKFVRLETPPSSTTLTSEQVDLFKEGLFVQGSFVNRNNPVFFPASFVDNEYHGIVIGNYGRGIVINEYTINSSNVISLGDDYISFDTFLNKVNVLGKTLPTPIDSPDIPMALLQGAGLHASLYWGVDSKYNIAPDFNTASTYALGALVIHDGILYKCTTAVETAGEWDGTKWTHTTLAEVIASL